jgi:hypothetical protein
MHVTVGTHGTTSPMRVSPPGSNLWNLQPCSRRHKCARSCCTANGSAAHKRKRMLELYRCLNLKPLWAQNTSSKAKTWQGEGEAALIQDFAAQGYNSCQSSLKRIGHDFELRDDLVQRLGAVHHIVARARVDRVTGALFFADNEDVVVPAAERQTNGRKTPRQLPVRTAQAAPLGSSWPACCQ